MRKIRIIPVNNGMYRYIYIDTNGTYHFILVDKDGNKDPDDFWHFQMSKEELQQLQEEYYNRKIPEDFWHGYEIVKKPLENASDGDVIMLLNWYRYKTPRQRKKGIVKRIHNGSTTVYECPVCENEEIIYHQNFCQICGAKLIWAEKK